MIQQLNKLFLIISIFILDAYAHVDDEVLYDFEKKCMICHDTYKKNNSAPPVVAINQIYTKKTKGDLPLAKKMIINFLSNPTHNRALMKPAVKLYGLMPNLNLSNEDMENFSDVILETDFEIPDWFEEHFKSHKLNLEHKDKPIN